MSKACHTGCDQVQVEMNELAGNFVGRKRVQSIVGERSFCDTRGGACTHEMNSPLNRGTAGGDDQLGTADYSQGKWHFKPRYTLSLLFH